MSDEGQLPHGAAPPRLLLVTGSNRPGRRGPAVSEWFAERVRHQGAFELELIDLALLDLPFLDEVQHPKSGSYEHRHTREWSSLVGGADAVVFVVPEYNHSFNAATKNAIDYLFHEWSGKPFGLVSYGGAAAGTRAVQALTPVLRSVKAALAEHSVNISQIGSRVEAGVLTSSDADEASAETLLVALVTACGLGVGAG